MATTKPAIPVNKKIPVATKQVPAKTNKTGTVISSTKKPAIASKGSTVNYGHGTVVKLDKKESAAFHSTKNMRKKTIIVAAAAIRTGVLTIPPAVQKAKAAAGTAVAKANLAKAVVKQVAAKEKLKAIDVAIKNTGSDTKGYQVSTHEKHAAFAAKREASLHQPTVLKMTKKESDTFHKAMAKKSTVKKIEEKKFAPVKKVVAVKGIVAKTAKLVSATDKAVAAHLRKEDAVDKMKAAEKDLKNTVKAVVKKAEPAKKSVKAVAKKAVKPATPATSASVAKKTASGHATSPAGSSEQVVVNPPAVVNKFVPTFKANPFLPKPAAAPTPAPIKVPAEMTKDAALRREASLKASLTWLGSTARIGS